MSRLITVEEFKIFRDVGNKVDESKVEECIDLAQDSDVYESLGDFYFKVLKNKDHADYAALMNGSEFEVDGVTMIHKGVKKWVADLVYSRYIQNVNVQMTAFGAHSKRSEDSSAIDRNHGKDLAKQAQIDAGNKFKVIKRYLETVDLQSESGKTATAGNGNSSFSVRISTF